jgi:hypothetical protein
VEREERIGVERGGVKERKENCKPQKELLHIEKI